MSQYQLKVAEGVNITQMLTFSPLVVAISNYSPWYIYVPDSLNWCPPWTSGVILPLSHATQARANWDSDPFGPQVVIPTPGITYSASFTFSDDPTATPSGGTIITQPVTIGGTVNIGTIGSDVPVIPGIFNLGGNGVKLVAVTGNAVAIHSSLTVKVIMVKARASNVGTIYIGTSSVTNNEDVNTGGLQLDPGDMASFTDTDIASVFINGLANDGVSFMYWV